MMHMMSPLDFTVDELEELMDLFHIGGDYETFDESAGFHSGRIRRIDGCCE